MEPNSSIDSAIKVWYWSQPGLVPTEEGHVCFFGNADILPLVYKVIRSATETLAIWEYISLLLQLLGTLTGIGDHSPIHRAYRALACRSSPTHVGKNANVLRPFSGARYRQE